IGTNDGTAMRGKGRQPVRPGAKVMLAFPGGAGYGNPKTRDRAAVLKDVRGGYVSKEAAMRDYGLSEDELVGEQRRRQ
ncbi:MAG: hydantoinase B/oxoprolinase family protein, partial [Hyphomicrobiales bacterium]|nr:hydantoinase B/oxoprolinase family protein [Hyphomicrobiales bacterium]